MKNTILLVAALALFASPALAVLTAEIRLEVKDDKVLAWVTVRQDSRDMTAGNITVKWTAPAGKFCADSSYELLYKAAASHKTRAYRSWMMAIPKTDCTAICDGTWKAEVVGEDGKVLAEASLTVARDGKAAEAAAPAKEEAKPEAAPAKPEAAPAKPEAAPAKLEEKPKTQ
jgi:hypothetical protein